MPAPWRHSSRAFQSVHENHDTCGAPDEINSKSATTRRLPLRYAVAFLVATTRRFAVEFNVRSSMLAITDLLAPFIVVIVVLLVASASIGRLHGYRPAAIPIRSRFPKVRRPQISLSFPFIQRLWVDLCTAVADVPSQDRVSRDHVLVTFDAARTATLRTHVRRSSTFGRRSLSAMRFDRPSADWRSGSLMSPKCPQSEANAKRLPLLLALPTSRIAGSK